ncbi:MAG: PAS domain S-box protein, partial [Pseudonocardiaceae bacterium]
MSTPAQPSSRAELARAWSSELRLTAYVPISDEEIDDFLRAQLDFLVDALGQSEFSPKPASGVGTRLVTQGFTGEQTLGATVEVLGRGLPAQHELRTVEELPSKVISLLGTLTRGFTTAFRHRVLDQQEDVQRALLRIRAIAERDRQVSEARFRGLFDSAPIGIAISRLDGSITETNRALTEILRYPPAELTGLGVRELFHPDDSTRLSAAYQELIEGQRLRFRAKVKLLAAKGDAAWASVAVSLLRDADGSPTHHVTMIEDSSDVHLLEQR